jgi:hypothetical protein
MTQQKTPKSASDVFDTEWWRIFFRRARLFSNSGAAHRRYAGSIISCDMVALVVCKWQPVIKTLKSGARLTQVRRAVEQHDKSDKAKDQSRQIAILQSALSVGEYDAEILVIFPLFCYLDNPVEHYAASEAWKSYPLESSAQYWHLSLYKRAVSFIRWERQIIVSYILSIELDIIEQKDTKHGKKEMFTKRWIFLLEREKPIKK